MRKCRHLRESRVLVVIQPNQVGINGKKYLWPEKLGTETLGPEKLGTEMLGPEK